MTFLATELQVARLLAARAAGSGKGTDRTLETQVAKVASKMGVDLKGNKNLAHAVASIENAVDKALAGLPKEMTGEDRLIQGTCSSGGQERLR